MASPNTVRRRLEQAHLKPRERFVIRRALIPVDKNSVRLRVTVEDPGYALDGRGNLVNPARRMTEADRRALGIRRNGQPRRARRALPSASTPDRKTAA
jgi:hypothetical protein